MLEQIPILRIKLQQKKFPIIIKYNDPVYYILQTTNGQAWNRRGSKYAKKFKIVAVRADQKIKPNCWRYTNNTKQEEKLVSELIKANFFIEKGNKICGIIILGEIENISNIRKSFSSSIIKKIKNRDCNKCVFCGSKYNCEVDHKDDLYITENKVLSEEDGQILCSHCNVTKRGGDSNTRYNRDVPPFLDKIASEVEKGIYFWYDPRKWIDVIRSKLKKERETICKLQNKIKEKDNIIIKLKADIERYERLSRKNKNGI